MISKKVFDKGINNNLPDFVKMYKMQRRRKTIAIFTILFVLIWILIFKVL